MRAIFAVTSNRAVPEGVRQASPSSLNLQELPLGVDEFGSVTQVIDAAQRPSTYA